MICPHCGGQLFNEYGSEVCLQCGQRKDPDYGCEIRNIVIKSDTGCPEAKEKGYDGQCIECPFPECFEDLKRKGTPRPLKKGDNRSMNPGRPKID